MDSRNVRGTTFLYLLRFTIDVMLLQQSVSDYRKVKIFITLFLLANALFLFSMPLLPFIDLPNHLAEATIYRYYGEAGNIISNYYKPTPWYFPNTFHTVFCSLFPDVEVGNKVFHVLCIMLMQVSVFMVVIQLNGNPWYALLGALFTYNYNFTYGFVGYAISTPTIIVLFYFIIRDFQRNTLLLKIGIAAILVLLFLMHAQNALLGLMLFGLLTLYQFRTSLKEIIIRGILIPLPLVILIFTWWFTRGGEKEESTTGYLLDYYQSHYIQDFAMRFRIAVFDNFQLREGIPGVVIALVIFLLVFVPILWFRPWQKVERSRLMESRFIYPFIFFFATLFCYLILPDQLPGQSPLFQRLCTIVILSFIILISVWFSEINSTALRYFSIIAIVGYSFLWFEYIYSFNQLNTGFNASLFQGIPNNSKMAGLIYDHKYRGRKVYIHFPNYFIVWNKGIAASKIIDYRFGVVRRVAQESEIPFYTEYIGDGYKKIEEYGNLDYLLVRGNAPVDTDANVTGFSVLRQSQQWSIYKRSK